MRSLVFATTELYPYTAGGVGRVLFNILRTMDDADRERTVVLVLDQAIDAVTFQSAFPGVELVQVSSQSDDGRHVAGRRHPPQWAYSDTSWHWRSSVVLRGLQDLASSRSIEYVEFPDWGALAFCTLQERLLSGFLSDATLAIRLHSTHTVLLQAEARSLSVVDLNLVDLERKCLRDCDLVVAQLPGVARFIRDIYGFASEEWDERVVCHAPPVLLDHHEPAERTVPADWSRPVLFTSKIQRFKRPDLFVRGIAGFMRQCADFTGMAELSAHSTDADYDAQIGKLIPTDLAQRFMFMPKLTVRERETRIAAATVVIPSVFESFCLAAYEASLLGARVILNGKNPAFDDESPWRDGVNCIKFDGSSVGLTQALARSLSDAVELVPIVLPREPWPWLATTARRPWAHEGALPTVSVVVPHYNLSNHLPETLENIVAFDYPNLEVVLVDDASTDPTSRQLVEMLARSQTPGLEVVQLPGNVGLAAARNVGIQRATGAYVVTLDADDLLDPRFVAKAVLALENQPEFDAVITPAAYFLDGSIPPLDSAADAADYAVFIGEARLGGLLQNRYSTATAIFRKRVFERFLYNEDLHCYEDWSLYMRLVDAGARFIVSTDAYFFYRKRPDSMVHAPRDNSRLKVDYADLLRTSAPIALRKGMYHLVAGIESPSAPASRAIPAALASALVAAQTEASLEELRHRTQHIEHLVAHVFLATAPLARLFRIPRYFWHRLLPVRRLIARARGRA